MRGEAKFSDDGMYRYALTRVWNPGINRATFIMLNPSTADAERNDPTIRRCIGFAQQWQFGGVNILNLYAYRATKPKDLWLADDPVGPKNNWWIKMALQKSNGPIIAAWGTNARADRVDQVHEITKGREVLCLGMTKAGHPRHPLYVRADQVLEVWDNCGVINLHGKIDA